MARRARRRKVALAQRFAVAILLCVAGGCTTIHPPDPASLKQPCTVHVARELGHLALFLPDRSGRQVEYGFGDRLYLSTSGGRGWLWSFVLVVDPFPTSGALIREPRGDLRLARIRAAGDTLLTFDVERAAMETLRDELDERWTRGAPCSHWPALHTSDESYQLFASNCQSVAVDWLRALGCTIASFRLLPRWHEWSLAPPEPAR